MAAGDYPFIWAFGYLSDDSTEPIDTLYVEGIRKGKFFQSLPHKGIRLEPWYASTSANPAGYREKGYEIAAFSWDTWLVDAVPLYLALGSAATHATYDYEIQGSTDGDVPGLVFHKEDNSTSTDIYRNYRTAKITRGELKIVENMLAMRLTAVAEQEISASVAQVTSFPGFRGDNSPSQPYRILGNTDLTCVWDLGTDITMSSYIASFAISWENPLHLHHLDDGNDYPSLLVDEGVRKFSPLVVDIVQKPGADVDLDDFVSRRDAQESGDLVIMIPRLHADDYLKLTFSDALLQDVQINPAPKDLDGVPTARLTFNVTNVVADEHQATSSGVSNPNSADTYELA